MRGGVAGSGGGNLSPNGEEAEGMSVLTIGKGRAARGQGRPEWKIDAGGRLGYPH